MCEHLKPFLCHLLASTPKTLNETQNRKKTCRKAKIQLNYFVVWIKQNSHCEYIKLLGDSCAFGYVRYGIVCHYELKNPKQEVVREEWRLLWKSQEVNLICSRGYDENLKKTLPWKYYIFIVKNRHQPGLEYWSIVYIRFKVIMKQKVRLQKIRTRSNQFIKDASWPKLKKLGCAISNHAFQQNQFGF